MADANDTFTGSDGTLLTSHTSDSGHSWTVQTSYSGNGAISSNQVKDNAGNAPNIYSSAVPSSAEYDVQMDVTGASDVMGPSGRCDTGANTSYFVLWNNGAGQWRLIERIAGVSTVLGTYAGDDPNGATVTVKLEIRDASKKVYFNGVEQISHTATNDITGTGRPGIKFSGVTSDRGDNWSFTNVGGGGGGSIAAISSDHKMRRAA